MGRSGDADRGEWALIAALIAVMAVGLGAAFWVTARYIAAPLLARWGWGDTRLAYGVTAALFAALGALGVLRQRVLERDPDRRWP